MKKTAMATPVALPSEAIESNNIISPVIKDVIATHQQTQYKTETSTGIKIKIYIPNSVSEPIRQHKINKIYDLLCPENLKQK